jgi:hypothetical protein
VHQDADKAARSAFWFAIVIFIGLALRLGLWLVAEPKVLPDTSTYMELAEQILRWDFSAYEGRRTPGYPVLLLLSGQSLQCTWVLQMIAGLAISACLFYIALVLTANARFACFVGSTYNLNLGQIFFETNLIPETETTVLVCATIACLVWMQQRLRRDDRARGSALLAGILAAAAIMARPQFVFLPVIVGIAAGYLSLYIGRCSWRRVVAHTSLAMAPGVLAILAWSSFNHFQVGRFTLSTQSGIGLMEHTIAFAELAPPEYEVMRDVLVAFRDRHLAQTGRYTATWDALPALKQATGLTLPALDRQLIKMSLSLILERPLRYLVLVADAWISFWVVSTPSSIREIRPKILASMLGAVWKLEQFILRIGNALFLGILGMAVCFKAFRLRVGWEFVHTVISAVVLSSSLLQAFVLGVDNARYGVTVQALIFFIVMIVAYRLLGFSTFRNRGGLAGLSLLGKPKEAQ